MVLECDKILFLRTDKECDVVNVCGLIPKDGDFRDGRAEAAKRQKNYKELKVPVYVYVMVVCNERIQETEEFQWVYIMDIFGGMPLLSCRLVLGLGEKMSKTRRKSNKLK